MKIFNWLNRKLNLKEGLAQDDGQRDGLISDQSSDDIRNLLGNNSFPSVFDGWKGGILSIGTFGYEAMNGGDEQDHEYYCIQQESPKEKNKTDPQEEEGEEEDEGMNLLVNPASLSDDYKGFLQMEMETEHYGVSPKQERTTLAQLFSADSEEKQRRKNSGEMEIMGENSAYKPHHTSTKKLVNEDAARPVHKLHRLLRRMLKTKVHPDINRNSKAMAREFKVQPYDSF